MLIDHREKFPIFKQKRKFVYFDNACITLLPQNVLDAINRYYMEYSGCHGRGGHLFGEETTKRYEEARIKIQKFINAQYPEEIIFTRNTTEGINLIAHAFNFESGDVVLTSDLEHNSNLLPWQKISHSGKIKHNIFSTNTDTSFNIENFKDKINNKTKIVSVLNISNLTGIEFPIQEISEIAHNSNAYLLVDAAQSLCSDKIDVQKKKIDFLVSSFHKNFGPSGIGFLYVRKSLLEKLNDFMVGGDTIIDTTYELSEYAPLPSRFEAGLQNYSGVIGAGESLNFVESIGQEKIKEHKIKLNSILSQKLKAIRGITILGPDPANERSGICNFILEGMDSFNLAKILSDSKAILTRPGFHCVHAWYHKNKIKPSLRISLQIYNTEEDILYFLDAIKDIARYFR